MLEGTLPFTFNICLRNISVPVTAPADKGNEGTEEGLFSFYARP